MIVKDNHKTLHRKLQCFFAGPSLFEAQLGRAVTREVGHGRVEERRLVVSADLPAGYTGFPGVAQVFRLTRSAQEKKSGARRREQTVYGMTSLPQEHRQGKPRALLALVRGHWHIENRSHHVRDVTFHEDRSQVRCGSTPQALSALRNACITLLRLSSHNNIAPACRQCAAQPHAALALLGIPKTE